MKENSDNTTERYLGNIAEELSTISGTCTKIKDQQLNCATTDDLNKFKEELNNDVVVYTQSVKTSAENCEGAVERASEQICDTVNDFKEEFNQKFDEFRSNPPVQKVDKTIHIARDSWQWYLTMGFTVFSTILLLVMIFWQEGRIEQCRISDIKYHFIMMHNGVTPEGLDSIESWFRNPDHVKQIEAEVREYENRTASPPRRKTQRTQLTISEHEKTLISPPQFPPSPQNSLPHAPTGLNACWGYYVLQQNNLLCEKFSLNLSADNKFN